MHLSLSRGPVNIFINGPNELPNCSTFHCVTTVLSYSEWHWPNLEIMEWNLVYTLCTSTRLHKSLVMDCSDRFVKIPPLVGEIRPSSVTRHHKQGCFPNLLYCVTWCILEQLVNNFSCYLKLCVDLWTTFVGVVIPCYYILFAWRAVHRDVTQ